MDAIWGDKFPKWARSQMTNAWSFLEQLDVVWFLTAVYLVVSLVGCSSLLSNRVILKEWNTTIRYNLWGAPRQQSTALESARWLSPAKCRVMMLLDARSSKFCTWDLMHELPKLPKPQAAQWDLPTSGHLPWAFIQIKLNQDFLISSKSDSTSVTRCCTQNLHPCRPCQSFLSFGMLCSTGKQQRLVNLFFG